MLIFAVFFFRWIYFNRALAEAPVPISYDFVLLFCLIKDSTYENDAVYLNFHVELIGNKTM